MITLVFLCASGRLESAFKYALLIFHRKRDILSISLFEVPRETMPIKRNAPVIILVRPQMAENIGAAARAMTNFGCQELRLVAPHHFDEKHALDMACDGSDLLKARKTFPDLKSALEDCTYSIATSRRLRRIRIPPLTPKEAIAFTLSMNTEKVALVFGSERAGLTNEELYLCDTASTIPTGENGSLNLGQSVVVYLYEWFQMAEVPLQPARAEHPLERLATHSEKQRVYELMHKLLVESGYNPPVRLPEFIRRIKYLFENRPLKIRENQILLKALRYFESKMKQE